MWKQSGRKYGKIVDIENSSEVVVRHFGCGISPAIREIKHFYFVSVQIVH